ncbi:sigma-70 family RNA polymerase sigma factor [Nakamurella alba]|uniref:sigma-70 family RNA polymerase sigma factor n=1 Tax=Nakamurella alba TaxID=2665158 RepID=UPI0018A97B6C|nr:sigma-70 family RNA polymerase sigma factor [Nakamurella alba]
MADQFTPLSSTTSMTTLVDGSAPGSVAPARRALAAVPAPGSAREERHTRVRQLLEQMVASTDPATKRRLMTRVITEHRGAARAVAARYRGKGVEAADLEQLAWLGLVKAAQRWEPGHCDDFLQYAVPTMTGEIKRYFRDHSAMVRPPRKLQEIRAAMTAADAGRQGEPHTDLELSEIVGVPVGSIREAREVAAISYPVSLDAPDRTGQENGRQLAAEDDGFGAVEDRMVIADIMAGLTERERRVVDLRFTRGLSQSEIGKLIGVSQMQVSRILRVIAEKARATVAGQQLALTA